jgi:hypothetical protein
MDLTIERIPMNEINEKARGRWDVVWDGLRAAFNSAEGGGIFLSPFTRSDTQNMSNALRRKAAQGGVRLRWKQAERNGQSGYLVWLESVTA